MSNPEYVKHLFGEQFVIDDRKIFRRFLLHFEDYHDMIRKNTRYSWFGMAEVYDLLNRPHILFYFERPDNRNGLRGKPLSPTYVPLALAANKHGIFTNEYIMYVEHEDTYSVDEKVNRMLEDINKDYETDSARLIWQEMIPLNQNL